MSRYFYNRTELLVLSPENYLNRAFTRIGPSVKVIKLGSRYIYLDWRHTPTPQQDKVMMMTERTARSTKSVETDEEAEKEQPLDETSANYKIIDGQFVFSDIEFGNFSLSDEFPSDATLIFRNCIFESLMLGYSESGSSITFENCIIQSGDADFSSRSYEKGLRIVNCQFLESGKPKACLELSVIYYGTSGTNLYLANNRFETFVDFFDSWLGELTVINNLFLKGSNIFDPDEWIETDTRIIEGNRGNLIWKRPSI